MRPLLIKTGTLVVLAAFLEIIIFPVAGPMPAWRTSLTWLAMVPLLWALIPAGHVWRPLHATLVSYAVGVVWNLGTCYWIYDAMHLYGNINAPVSAFITLLYAFYIGLYYALFGWLLNLVQRRAGIAAALAASPFLWVATELARSRITCVPWCLLGYAQVDNFALTRLAPITGVYGLSFVIMFVNAGIACALVLPGRRRPATIALVAAVLATGIQNVGNLIRPQAHIGTHKAILLQPNLDVGVGASEDVASAAASSAALTLRAASLDSDPTAIALWPESPSPFQTDLPAFTTVAASVARELHAPLIAGTIGIQPDAGIKRGYHVYNSAALFTPQQGYSGRYDKIHLVPYGEYVPFAPLFQFASGLTQAVGTFDRGVSRAPLTADGHRYGPFICYEAVFGDEVRHFAANGAEVLTNISDDGWYGDTSAPFQHINMARMRAIENDRWILRDTNNGITASIDPNGRVVENMPRHQRGAVAVHFDYRTTTTFYSAHGDLFAYLITLIALVSIAFSLMNRENASQTLHQSLSS